MLAQERKYYNRIKKAMEVAGTYSPVNDTVIEHAAITLALLDGAKKHLKSKGQIQNFKTGARQISPELNNFRGLMADFLKYAKALGLTPGELKSLGGAVEKEKTEKPTIMHLAKAN